MARPEGRSNEAAAPVASTAPAVPLPAKVVTTEPGPILRIMLP